MKLIFKNIFKDFVFTYKNFGNWLKNKVIIYLFTILVGVVLSSVFLAIYSIFSENTFMQSFYTLFNAISLNSFSSSIIYLYEAIGYFVILLINLDFASILFLASGVLFTTIFLYSYILLAKVSLEYVKGKTFDIKKMDFLNWKRFLKYTFLTKLVVLITLIPSIIFAILTLLLVLVYGGQDIVMASIIGGKISSFTVISLILFLVTIFSSIYLVYRVVYSYMYLVEDKKDKDCIIVYLKKSIKNTAGLKKMFKTLAVLLVFGLVIIPFNAIGNTLAGNYANIQLFQQYSVLNESQKEQYKQQNLYTITSLEAKYASLTSKEIENKISNYEIFMIIFSFIKFMAVFGILNLVFVSTYKRIITKK